MKEAPIPHDELERLNILKSLKILDTPEEERFDRITKTAKEKLNVSISTISLIDHDREWLKSCVGVDTKEGPRNISFCGHTITSKDVLIIPDTQEDHDFKDNPYVTGSRPIRFYAGVPLKSHHKDKALGVLCVKDYTPRTLTKEEIDTLLQLAKEAEYELNKRYHDQN